MSGLLDEVSDDDQPQAAQRNANKSVWPWIVFVAAMLFIDGLILPCSSVSRLWGGALLSNFIRTFGFGCFSGQACLMAVVGGLYGSSWLKGFSLAVALGATGVTALLLGERAYSYFSYGGDLLAWQYLIPISLTPMFILAISTPMLVFRTIYGWRLNRNDAARTDREVFGIEEILIVTAVSAASLVLVRSVQDLMQVQDSQFWTPIAVIYTIMAAASLVAVVPAVWIAFRIAGRTRRLTLLAVIAIAFTCIVLVAGTVVGRAFPNSGAVFPFGTFAYYAGVFLLGASLEFVMGLEVLRISGFKLGSMVRGTPTELQSPSSKQLAAKQHRRLAAAIFAAALATNIGIAVFVARRDAKGAQYQSLDRKLAERNGGLRLDREQTGVSSVILGDSATESDLKEVLHFQDLQTLSLADSSIDDDDLKLLEGFRHMRTLDLSGTQITDAGLNALKDLPALETVRLARTRVTIDGVINLMKNKEIMSLDLGDLGLNDSDLERLAGLPVDRPHPLQSIALRGNPISDRGLAALVKRQSHIQELDLADCQIDERGLSQLPKRTFRKLVLDGTPIVDSAFGPLLQGLTVRRLSFDRTQITDAILPSLAKATGITGLALGETRITEAGIGRSGIQSLNSLSLNSKRFDGSCFATWMPSRLTELDLSYSAVNDRTIASVAKFSNLRTLNLSRTGITDTALPVLAECSAFQIDLSHTEVTAGGLAGSALVDKEIHLGIGQFSLAELKQIRKTIRVYVGVEMRTIW